MPPRATPRTARGENSTALVTREAARSSVRSQPLGGPDDSPTTTEEDAEQRMTPAEQRRARHRRVVKQSYYRKLVLSLRLVEIWVVRLCMVGVMTNCCALLFDSTRRIH